MAKPFAAAIRSPAWYNSPEWLFLRAAQLAAEEYCTTCREQGRLVPATDADHVIPHRGDRNLFFDPVNLQSLCRLHHNQKTGRENRPQIPPRRRPAEKHPGLI